MHWLMHSHISLICVCINVLLKLAQVHMYAWMHVAVMFFTMLDWDKSRSFESADSRPRLNQIESAILSALCYSCVPYAPWSLREEGNLACLQPGGEQHPYIHTHIFSNWLEEGATHTRSLTYSLTHRLVQFYATSQHTITPSIIIGKNPEIHCWLVNWNWTAANWNWAVANWLCTAVIQTWALSGSFKEGCMPVKIEGFSLLKRRQDEDVC